MSITRKLDAIIGKYRLHPQFLGIEISDPNQPGAMGDTMLHLASEAGAVEDVEALVGCGARVNAVGDIGNTPLHSAALMGHSGVAKKLLQLGANPRLKNEFGERAEDVALNAGHKTLADMLKAR